MTETLKGDPDVEVSLNSGRAANAVTPDPARARKLRLEQPVMQLLFVGGALGDSCLFIGVMAGHRGMR